MIEPAQVQIGKQISGKRSCAIGPFLEAPQKVAMRPGTNYQVLKRTCQGTASPLPHALVMLQVFPLEVIVPAGDCEGRHGDLLIKLLLYKRTPILIEGRMRQPVEVVRRSALKQGHVNERKSSEESWEIATRLPHLLQFRPSGPALAYPPLDLFHCHTRRPSKGNTQQECAPLIGIHVPAW